MLRKDILNELTNKKYNNGYAFQFEISDGKTFYEYASIFFQAIVQRAFSNSCHQMDYALESCLKELNFYWIA